MPTHYVAPTANYVSKTLNGAISDSATTITLNNTTNLQAPGYVVIDRTNSSGTATPGNREVVSYTGISGSDLTGCTRGADGSTNRSHSDGAIVETMPTVGMWNNLATIVASGFDSNGYLKAIGSPVSIARMQMTQGVVPSILSVARLEGAFTEIKQAAITSVVSIAEIRSVRSFLSSATIITSANASGASIVGFTPASLVDEDITGSSSTTSSTFANITGADVSVTVVTPSHIVLLATVQAYGNVDLAPYTIQWHDGSGNIGASSRVYLRSSNPRTTVCVNTVVQNKAAGTYTYTLQHKSEDNSSSLTAETISCIAFSIPA